MVDRSADRRTVGGVGLAIRIIVFWLAAQGAVDGALDTPRSVQAPAIDPTVSQGVYTKEQAKRGATAYQETCASCHLDDMSGQHTTPPLAGETFLLNYQQQTLGDLFQRIRTTMPQGSAGSLSGQAYADILAFILEANQFPAGSRELASDIDELEKIPIRDPSRK